MSSSTPDSNLREIFSKRDHLLLDGATGTELFSRGLDSGGAPELWNLQEPEKIKEVYKLYVDAGSNIFLTNSFGGTHFRLALHNLENDVYDLNKAAASLARQVADFALEQNPQRVLLVAGSMGPTGELFEPMGSMSTKEAVEAFAQQAEGLAAGGTDLIWVETMSSLEEVSAAVEGARSVCDLQICATLSFDTAGRTMMGVTGTQVAEQALELGLAAVGANCGNNLSDTEAAVKEMRAVSDDLLIISKGNAGIPQWKGAELHYSANAEVMAAHAMRVKDAGAQIIGGCCGSTPEHVEMMGKVLDGETAVPEVEVETATTRLVAKKSRPRRRRSSSN